MAYLIIESFGGGVDRRRPIYALPPGTLWEAANCHISRGGDIEKRKKFVDLGEFLPNTFGLIPKGDVLYTFGSVDESTVIPLPPDVVYQRLMSPDNQLMQELVYADLFGGGIFAIAKFIDGSTCVFYNGTLVADWEDGVVRFTMTNLHDVAVALAALVDASFNFAATAVGNTVVITSQNPGIPFTTLGTAINGGVVDDQAISIATTTANVPAVAGVAAGRDWQVTAGTGAGSITSITVNAIEILINPVTWSDSNITTAALIATEINLHTGSTGWTADSDGQFVAIHKNVVGVADNGLPVVATTAGDMQVNGLATGVSALGDTFGGVDAVPAVAQIDTVTLSGTTDIGDAYGLRITTEFESPKTEYFGNYAKPTGIATVCKTHKRKEYVGAGALLEFSEVNDATKWNVDTDPGAGFLNASTHVGGSESVTALGSYQGRLAVFSRRAIQLWLMQNDDALNDLQQVLENTGTRSPKSVLEYAGNDLFYLDDNGIRSLRARDASNNAYLADVGVAIDKLVREWVRDSVSDAQFRAAVAAIEPVDGRFWLAIGTRIFIYSYFPTSKVAAWTWYEPGFVPEWFARTKTRLYVRANNHLYLYGGFSGDEYDEDMDVRVQMPFATMGKPGTFKDLTGINMAATGEWSVKLHINPNNLVEFVDFGTDEGVSYPSPDWTGVGHTPYIAPELTHRGAGPASLSNFSINYTTAEEA